MSHQSFDLTSQAFKRNPHPTFARMREAGPIVRTKLPLIGEMWLTTTYEAANLVLRDSKKFALNSRNAGKKKMAGLQWWMPRSILVLTKNMLTSDEPDHRRLRNLVEQAFLRQSVEEMRGRLGILADQFLDNFEHQAKANSGVADFAEHFSRPFPLAVICELLGLPEEDRPKFSKWASSLTNASSAFGTVFAMFGIKKMLRYLQQQFQACREQPRPGLISALVEARHEGQQLSEEELLAMAFLLLFAGHETTVHLINGSVLTLLEHEDQKAALMADWSLVGSAVDETLRYFSPIQFTKPRYAKEDMDLCGQAISRGEPILALLASANCDPAEFDEPDRFDIRRDPNHHLGFGGGIHICLGLKLAKAEVEIALEKLFTRFPDLALAVEPSELKWGKRIGMRALTAFPVQLHPAN